MWSQGPVVTATMSAAPVRGAESSAHHATPARLTYPRAAQSEIVRAHQKDVYYRDLFSSQLKEVASEFLGARRSHVYAESLSLVASVAYFGLSTLGGAQSLGEEYVNAMMRDRPTGKIVNAKRRAVFIALYIVAPYLLTKMYGMIRMSLVRKDQEIAQRRQRELVRAQMAARDEKSTNTPPSVGKKLQRRWEATIQWLALVLPGSHVLAASNGLLAYASAAQLAVFYLFGRYYTVAHRLAKVDYVYASAKRPNSRPQSYEVLGVLLGTQLLVKLGMTVYSAYQTYQEKAVGASHDTGDVLGTHDPAVRPSRSVVLDDTYYSHADHAMTKRTETSTDPTIPLEYPDPEAPATAERLGLAQGAQAADRQTFEAAVTESRAKTTQLEAIADEVLRCTLCMDRRTPEVGNSAVTECGHVFCWDCITGWIKEKPECPLCRQSVQCNRLVPIYNL